MNAYAENVKKEIQDLSREELEAFTLRLAECFGAVMNAIVAAGGHIPAPRRRE